MLSTLVPLIPHLVLRLLVASVVAGGSYFLWRFLEKKSASLISITSVLIGLAGIALNFLIDYRSSNMIVLGYVFLLATGLIVISGILGYSYHHRSGGESKNKIQSWLLLFVASWSSLLSGSLIKGELFWITSFDLYLDGYYFFLLLTCPSLTPFLFWIWQNRKLRPGIDEHLKS